MFNFNYFGKIDKTNGWKYISDVEKMLGVSDV